MANYLFFFCFFLFSAACLGFLGHVRRPRGRSFYYAGPLRQSEGERCDGLGQHVEARRLGVVAAPDGCRATALAAGQPDRRPPHCGIVTEPRGKAVADRLMSNAARSPSGVM